MLSDERFHQLRSLLFWFVAILITASSAAYQRISGPSYPVKGAANVAGEEIRFKLERTHGGPGDQIVRIPVPNSGVSGVLFWKRFKTDDPWTSVPMTFENASLEAALPHQPPAGKLMYRVTLNQDGGDVELLGGAPVVIRFKGATPDWILFPHIAMMFAGMLVSARAGFAVFEENPPFRRYALVALVLLGFGGFLLGPIMQKYAFDAYWTGYPFGTDLTDNKTAVAILGWAAAVWALWRNSPKPKIWILCAAFVTFSVFLVPHSMFGSELDYTKVPAAQEPAPADSAAEPTAQSQ